MATRAPTTRAVALLTTKLSHEVVAQTSKVRLAPGTGATAATDAEMRARDGAPAAACSDRSRSRSRSMTWNASAAVGAWSNTAGLSRFTEAEAPDPPFNW